VGTEHVLRALAQQGNLVDAEEVAALAAEVDADGSGGLDFNEWLMCHRKARDKERQRGREAFKAIDADSSGRIPAEQVTDLLYLLGCLADHGTVLEIAEEVSSPRERLLSAEDVEEFLRLYLVRDGLSQETCASVQAAMERYDPDGDGFVGSDTAGKLLRWFGHNLTFEDVLRTLAQLDLEVPGQLKERDVRRLLRRIQEGALQRMHAAFEAQDPSRSGHITKAQAREALHGMKLLEGTEACPGSELPEVIQAIPSAKCVDGLGRTAFVYVASQHAARARESFRQNAGYSANELAELRQAFQSCDADGSGLISNSELVALVMSMFPVVNSRIKRRLGQLMQEVEQRAGEMDFPDFVRLVRQFHDLRVQEMVEKEKCAVADTHFSPEEVAGFRELFLETSAASWASQAGAPASEKELPLQSLLKLVGNICSVSQSKEKTILGYVMDAKAKCEAGGAVVRRQDVDADGSLAVMVDFAEFLRVMRQLLEANFGNVAGDRPPEASTR
jgi:calmodulin